MRFLAAAVSLLAAPALADIPVHCLWNTTVGDWTFHMSDQDLKPGSSCADFTAADAAKSIAVTISGPNKAVVDGTSGKMTLVSDQGMRVWTDDLDFFGFFNYTKEDGVTTSHCGQTSPLYYTSPQASEWGCFVAEHASAAEPGYSRALPDAPEPSADEVVRTDEALVERLRELDLPWTVASKSFFDGWTHAERAAYVGGRPVKFPLEELAPPLSHNDDGDDDDDDGDLPESFDWSNVSGVDYMPAMRDQLNCGSCFAFASTTAMTAARWVQSGEGPDDVMYSPQDVLSCATDLAQGCSGGFAYLVGRQAVDMGIASDARFPYQSGIRDDVTCAWKDDYTQGVESLGADGYAYVGGYYGGCSERAMQKALLKYGPLPVGILVDDYFMQYEGGVYVTPNVTSLSGADGDDDPEPYYATGHAVTVFGYGVDDAASGGLPYWSVRNSWGSSWGEHGNFRILRGANEMNIETQAVYFSIGG